MALATKQQLVPTGNRYQGSGTNTCEYLTIHQTDNWGKGAGAQAHANLQANDYKGASWHWQVDSTQAIQSYPETAICWHAGDGGNGPGNRKSISIEMCLNPESNYAVALDNCAQLAAQIMKRNGIPMSRLVQHNRWTGKNCPSQIRKNGEWAAFRAKVEGYLGSASSSTSTGSSSSSSSSSSTSTGKLSVSEVAKQVIAGNWGNGADRQSKLTAAGYNHATVQAEVNAILAGKPTTGATATTPAPVAKSVATLAAEVLAGKHGNGDARKKSLGSQYAAVQTEVNRQLAAKATPAAKPAVDIDALARRTINGDFGNGDARKKALGSNYAAVQARVNQMLK